MSICEETRLRIRLAVCAWAYEMHDDPLVSDDEFDAMAQRVDLSATTARPDLDEWFRQHFNPDTGIWVRSHPEPEALERIYRFLRRPRLTALQLWILAP